jgi:glycosyltransferase involved in cell wall biosynthesis
MNQISAYDVIYLEYESLPYVPFSVEKLIFRTGARVIVDYDDATYVTYQHHPLVMVRWLLGSKIPKIVSKSYGVIVGNRHLFEWATSINQNVVLIPTSVDLNRYSSSDRINKPSNGKAVIGWIGTPITARYLRLIEQSLRMLRSRYEFTLKVIGAPDFKIEGIKVLSMPWSEETEVTQLRTCDIGIMPLPDTPWTRGKSALKLIQYLAIEVPAVASPVGANCDVIQDGRNGFHARSEKDWVDKLCLLISNPILRKQLAENGRRTVESQYSVQHNADRWVQVLQRAADA